MSLMGSISTHPKDVSTTSLNGHSSLQPLQPIHTDKRTTSANVALVESARRLPSEDLQNDDPATAWADDSNRPASEITETRLALDISTTTVFILQQVTVTAEVTVVSTSPLSVWKTITVHTVPDAQEEIPQHLGESAASRGQEKFPPEPSETATERCPNDLKTTYIVGGALGGLVVFLLVGLVVLAVRRRRPIIQFVEARQQNEEVAR